MWNIFVGVTINIKNNLHIFAQSPNRFSNCHVMIWQMYTMTGHCSRVNSTLVHALLLLVLLEKINKSHWPAVSMCGYGRYFWGQVKGVPLHIFPLASSKFKNWTRTHELLRGPLISWWGPIKRWSVKPLKSVWCLGFNLSMERPYTP